jgi:CBS-domain-containing membrane protein
MNHREIIAGAAGGAVAIGIMELLSARTMTPLAAIPFATSIVLVLGSPDVPPAQPRALVGGHLVSALAGLLVVKICGPDPWAAAFAVGLAIAAMQVAGMFHPPAGINPLLIVLQGFSWDYLLVPVASGAVLLLIFAYLWNNFVRGERWPSRWT